MHWLISNSTNTGSSIFWRARHYFSLYLYSGELEKMEVISKKKNYKMKMRNKKKFFKRNWLDFLFFVILFRNQFTIDLREIMMRKMKIKRMKKLEMRH